MEQAADERSWRLLDTFEENVGVGPGLDRPALHRALEALASGDAHILAVSSIDRLALSLSDLAVLIRWFEAAAGPSLVSVGPDVIKIDTSTDEGRTFATAIAHLGEWERAAASRRMREALLARRAAGGRISRPAVVENENLTLVVKRLREQGRTLQQIADQLNQHDVPTLRGGAKVETFQSPSRTRASARSAGPYPCASIGAAEHVRTVMRRAPSDDLLRRHPRTI